MSQVLSDTDLGGDDIVNAVATFKVDDNGYVNYYRNDQDLNDGAGGKYIYLSRTFHTHDYSLCYNIVFDEDYHYSKCVNCSYVIPTTAIHHTRIYTPLDGVNIHKVECLETSCGY